MDIFSNLGMLFAQKTTQAPGLAQIIETLLLPSSSQVEEIASLIKLGEDINSQEDLAGVEATSFAVLKSLKRQLSPYAGVIFECPNLYIQHSMPLNVPCLMIPMPCCPASCRALEDGPGL